MTRTIKTGLLFLALLLAAPSAGAEGLLTHDRIMAMFSAIESAVHKKDADGVVQHFASDSVIRLIMPPAAGGQTLELSVPQYKSMLRDGWAMAEASSYAVQDIKVQISKDQRSARVTDTTVETMKVQGQTISSRTQEEFSVKLIGGEPRVTELTGRVQM